MDIEFNSEDIKNQQKPQYFVNTRQKPDLRAFFVSLNQKPLFRGWRKYALLGVMIVAVVAPVVIISIVNRPQSPNESAIETPPVRVAQEVYEEALAVSKGGSASAYFDALAVFDTAINEGKNEEAKSEIKYLKAEFYYLKNATDEAIVLLTELINQSQITDALYSKVSIRLTSIYRAMGNTAMADELLQQYNERFAGGQ